MPILIKSSGGQRTCKIMTNDSREDLIEALKGLTFKFEVKIVDVERKPSSEVKSSFDSSDSDGPKPSVLPRQPVSQKPAAESKSVNEGLKRSFESSNEHRSTVVPKVFAEPRATQESDGLNKSNREAIKPSLEPKLNHQPQWQEPPLAKEPVDPIKPTYEVKTSAPAFVPSILTKKLGIMDRPRKPKLVRGELKPRQRTCCITVENAEYPAVAYIAYNNQKLLDISQEITEVSDDIQAQAEVRSVEVGDIVFAKSKDDNSWYRSMVESVIDSATIEVNFFDWGLFEKLELDRIRRMNHVNLGLSAYPACAVKVKFTNHVDDPLLEKALVCEHEFDIEVNSYDAKDDAHSVTILNMA